MPRLQPDLDADELRALYEEIRGLRADLVDLKRIGADLISTSRFQRGGYDGPFLRPKFHIVGYHPPFPEIHAGREDPTALLIECDGTGVAGKGDRLLISDDRGNMEGGYSIALERPVTIATGNPLRIIADRHQRFFARAIIEAGVGDTAIAASTEPVRREITVSVREGRL